MVSKVISKCWEIFDRKKRMESIGICVIMIVSGILEFLGLATVAVFLGYVLDPSMLQKSEKVLFVLDVVNIPLSSINYYSLGAVTIILLTTGVVFNFAVQVGIVGYGASVTRDLTRAAVRATLSAPVSWHSKQNSSEISQRLLQDASSIGNTVFPAILEFAYALIMIIIATIVVLTVSSVTGLLVIAGVGLLAAIAVTVIRNKIQLYSGKFRTAIEGSNRLGVEAFLGAREIKIKTREEFYIQKYMDVYSAANQSKKKINVLFRIVPTFFVLFGQLGMILVVLSLFWTGVQREDVLQQVAFLAVIVSRLLPSLTRLTGTIGNIATGKPFLDGYQAQMAELRRFELPPPAEGGFLPDLSDGWKKLEVSGVSFRYQEDGKNVLNQVSLTIENGKSYAFVGQSGAGKSTIVDIIMGLQAPTSGCLKLDGTDFNPNHPAWYRKIGYVAQFPFLSDDTILANVAFGLEAEDINLEKVRASLEAAGLTEFVNGHPDGLLTRVGDKGVRFSGGQRQRIAIARALYDSPELLVFDEATSALDVLTERAIQDTIRSLKGTVTSITIAHRLSTVVECDELFLLNEGHLVGKGDFKSLQKESELFRSMVSESAG
ncbi:ABC transporter ATP-binding protein [Thalassospira sp. HF15]|uniref:ABC transporter ATP-binding protein n=1 Tax=Thalassospira sp. HF15 TaxID=2722755 RepID=UPI00142F7BDD|nr:ABC transporter ATP-binding protein [Thalassospira sp. HF15]NIY75449.1 ABC transporter ATP-binding protein [Thalassospira sp. HF15]